MKKHSRFTAFLMTVLLVLSMLPSAVFASEFVTLDGQLKIKGDAVTESVLSADYEKVTPGGITDDQVKFLWMRTTLEAEEKAELEETENLTRQEIGKEKTYTVAAEDVGYIIVLQITGLEEMGYTGSLTAKTEVITAAVTEEVVEESLGEEPTETLAEPVGEEPTETPAEPVSEEPTETPVEPLSEEWDEELTEAEPFDEDVSEEEASGEETLEEETFDEESWDEELFDVVIESEEMLMGASLAEEPALESTETIEEVITEEGTFDENGTPVNNVEPVVISALSVNPAVVDFGTHQTTSGIEAQQVSVTNNGSTDISIEAVLTVNLLEEDSCFSVERVLAEGEDASVLAAGATATYKILPVEGLTGNFEVVEEILFRDKADPDNNYIAVEIKLNVEESLPTETPEPTPEVPVETPEPTPTEVPAEPTATPEPIPTEVPAEPTETPEPIPTEVPAEPTATPEPTPTEVPAEPTATPEPTPTEVPAEPTATPEPTPTEVPVEKIMAITVQPASHDFGTKEEGYGTAPGVLQVTVKNHGNTKLTLIQPKSGFCEVGALSATVLQPNETAVFTVQPKLGLEKGQYQEVISIDTEEGISDIVDVHFQVTEKAREPQIATADQNKIKGITTDAYTTQSKITFTAVGGGMDNTNPAKGDVRYCPLNWSVFNVNSWKNSDYSASFGMGKAGTYNLSVTFARQQFDGNGWVNTGEQDTKTVSFKVVEADDSVKLTPAAEKDTNQKDAVKTGDTTVILPLIIALLVALACVIGVLVYRKKR